MTDRQVEKLLEIFQKRMQRVTDEYLRRMGKQLKEIGEIIPSAETRLIQMRNLRMNLKYIQGQIALEYGQTISDIEKVFKAIAKSNARFAKAYFGGEVDEEFLMQPVLAQLRATAEEMQNLSRTTIESQLYRDAVDEGIQATQAGVEDYNSAIRRAMKKAAEGGIRFRSESPSVVYPNGRTKRLDSAVRQNILDGIRKLNQANMQMIGEKFGADGIELSAHAMCAEDHLEYQGRQFTNEEFAAIQSDLQRPFGEWNCRHSWRPILMGISEPAYTDEELEMFRENSTKKITIDGKTKSRYEWTQEQRKIETAVRYQQDIATAAKASGDRILMRQAQKTIKTLNEYYGKIVDKANVPNKSERMGTYYGKNIRRPKISGNALKESKVNGKIEETRALIRSGATTKTINPEKQNRHIREEAGYTEGRSYIYGTVQTAQELIDRYHGTGQPVYSRKGIWKKKEIIAADRNIGVNIDASTGIGETTTRFVIHYSKTGTHIVPTSMEGTWNGPE